MHWNVSIGPEKLPIFGRFLTLFPLKRPARREKNTSNMAVTIGDANVNNRERFRITMNTVSVCDFYIPGNYQQRILRSQASYFGIFHTLAIQSSFIFAIKKASSDSSVGILKVTVGLATSGQRWLYIP
jgi:hypothetical protein